MLSTLLLVVDIRTYEIWKSVLIQCHMAIGIHPRNWHLNKWLEELSRSEVQWRIQLTGCLKWMNLLQGLPPCLYLGKVSLSSSNSNSRRLCRGFYISVSLALSESKDYVLPSTLPKTMAGRNTIKHNSVLKRATWFSEISPPSTPECRRSWTILPSTIVRNHCQEQS